MATVAETLWRWRRRTTVPDHTAWSAASRLDDPQLLAALLDVEETDRAAAYQMGLASGKSVQRVLDLEGSILDDIAELSPVLLQQQPGEWTGRQLLRVAASGRAAFEALTIGDLRATRYWLLRALTDEDPESPCVEIGMIAPEAMCHPAQPLPDVLVVPTIANWAETLFVYDRYVGDLRDPATKYFSDYLEPWLARRLSADPDVLYVALSAAQWSRDRNVDDARLKASLREVFARDDNDEIRPRLAVYFAWLASGVVGEGDPVELAADALDRYAGRLFGTEMLQLVSILASRMPLAAAEDNAKVVDAIEGCITDWQATTPDRVLMADRRGARLPLGQQHRRRAARSRASGSPRRRLRCVARDRA